MNDLSPEAKSLFGAARRELGPSAEDRARLDRHLGARLGAAMLTTSTLAAAGNTGSAAAGLKLALPLLVKWLGVGLLVGGGVTSGYLLLRAPNGAATSRDGAPVAAAASTAALVAKGPGIAAPSPAAEPALADDPAPAGGLAPPSENQSDPVTATAPRPAASVAAHAAVAAPDPVTAPSARVGEETALMRRAHEALRAGDANRALSLLRDHALRFPSGILAEERRAELVTTLCQLGRKAEAEREAASFLRELPGSSLAPSVRASCAFAPSATQAR